MFAAASIVSVSLYLHAATYKYTAEIKVSPAQSSKMGNARLSQLSGLASIAGVSLPQDAASMSFSLYLEGLKSLDVARELAKDPQVMHMIFAAEWDPSRQAYFEPRGPLTDVIRSTKSMLGVPNYVWQPPDAQQLQSYLSRNIQIIQNAKSPVVVLTYENKDPRFAANLLQKLHSAADNSLRGKARVRAEENVAFLNQELSQVTNIELRTSLASAQTEQVMQLMTASSSLAFAAEPFGKPIVSLRPTSPRPIILLIAGAVGGLMIGSLCLLLFRNMGGSRSLPMRPEQATWAERST